MFRTMEGTTSVEEETKGAANSPLRPSRRRFGEKPATDSKSDDQRGGRTAGARRRWNTRRSRTPGRPRLLPQRRQRCDRERLRPRGWRDGYGRTGGFAGWRFFIWEIPFQIPFRSAHRRLRVKRNRHPVGRAPGRSLRRASGTPPRGAELSARRQMRVLMICR
jgi:hypothetical protein